MSANQRFTLCFNTTQIFSSNHENATPKAEASLSLPFNLASLLEVLVYWERYPSVTNSSGLGSNSWFWTWICGHNWLWIFVHTCGYAPAGVITSCLAGVGSATTFIVVLSWDAMFHLWYVNLAVLLVAVPIRVILKAILAGLFIILYGGMFFIFPIMTGTSMPPRSP